jgi:hypothetical protein
VSVADGKVSMACHHRAADGEGCLYLLKEGILFSPKVCAVNLLRS